MKKLLTLNLILSLLAIWLTIGGGLPEAIRAKAVKINPVKKMEKTAAANPMEMTSSSSTVINWADLDIFYDYKSWPHSNNKKTDDVLPQFIHEIIVPYDGYGNFHANSMTDLNGDGLMDMIYHYGYYRSDDPGHTMERMAIWINKGNNNFQLIYKCYVDNYEGWYGDCAAV